MLSTHNPSIHSSARHSDCRTSGSLRQCRHVHRRSVPRRFRVQHLHRRWSAINHGVGLPSASWKAHRHVQHALVCGFNHRGVDCLRNHQVFWRLLVACSCRSAGSHADSPTGRSLHSSREPSMALLQRKDGRGACYLSQGQFAFSLTHLRYTVKALNVC